MYGSCKARKSWSWARAFTLILMGYCSSYPPTEQNILHESFLTCNALRPWLWFSKARWRRDECDPDLKITIVVPDLWITAYACVSTIDPTQQCSWVQEAKSINRTTPYNIHYESALGLRTHRSESAKRLRALRSFFSGLAEQWGWLPAGGTDRS